MDMLLAKRKNLFVNNGQRPMASAYRIPRNYNALDEDFNEIQLGA